MLIYGLTGNIATGKTTASKYFKSISIPIIDADEIAKEIVLPGKRALNQIQKEFGSSVISSDGSLNRSQLGSIIFTNPEKRKRLNGITHPYIIFEMVRQTILTFIFLHPVVILDTPLLFEGGLDKWVHKTVLVYCSPKDQLNRLMQRDQSTREQAESRIQSQMPIEEKRNRADFIIDNSGSKQDMELELQRFSSSSSFKPSPFWTIIYWQIFVVPLAFVLVLMTLIKRIYNF